MKRSYLIGLIIIGIFGSLALNKLNPSYDSPDIAEKAPATSQTIKSWSDMSYEEKDAWVKAYLKKPDGNGYIMVSRMREAVKSKFRYPDEVDFDYGSSPTFVKADVVDADRATVFVRGSGKAKNAFGVKGAFSYSIRVIVSKDSLFMDDVSVSTLR